MRLSLVGVIVVCAVSVIGVHARQAPPLVDGLVVQSTVEVAEIPIQPTALASQIAMSVSPFRLSPGRADVVTSVSGAQVRVEGLGARLGFPDDVVLLTMTTGEVVGIRPERQEWFVLPSLTTPDREALFRHSPVSRKRGNQARIDGVLTRKYTRTLSGEMQWLDGIERVWDPKTDRLVEAWTLPETAEERTARFLRMELALRSNRTRGREVPVVVERWEAEGHGPLGTLLANSPVDIDSLATFHLVDGGDEALALRQVVVNPTTGRRVESKVGAITHCALDAHLFEVPAGYRRVSPVSLK